MACFLSGPGPSGSFDLDQTLDDVLCGVNDIFVKICLQLIGPSTPGDSNPKKYFGWFPRGKKAAISTRTLISSAGAAVRGPFSWRAANAPPRNSAPPSDSQAEGPICRDIVPGSCCTGF